MSNSFQNSSSFYGSFAQKIHHLDINGFSDHFFNKRSGAVLIISALAITAIILGAITLKGVHLKGITPLAGKCMLFTGSAVAVVIAMAIAAKKIKNYLCGEEDDLIDEGASRSVFDPSERESALVMTALESSVERICPAQEIMIYGYASCGYRTLSSILSASSTTHIKKIFDFKCGENPSQTVLTLKGLPIAKIEYSSSSDYYKPINRACKSAIVNIVFENLKRKRQKEEIIPILFCIDRTDNPHPPTPAAITARNGIVTNKELRRAYKLCEELEDPEINAVARETFRFAKWTGSDKNNFNIEPIKAPWKDKNWKKSWEERIRTKKPSREASEKTKFWREELLAMKATLPSSASKSPPTSLSKKGSD